MRTKIGRAFRFLQIDKNSNRVVKVRIGKSRARLSHPLVDLDEMTQLFSDSFYYFRFRFFFLFRCVYKLERQTFLSCVLLFTNPNESHRKNEHFPKTDEFLNGFRLLFCNIKGILIDDCLLDSLKAYVS